MSRHINRLSAVKVRNLTEPGQHADGNGLYLTISKAGSKAWSLIYKWKKKRTELGLGPTHAVSLALAREKAQEAAQLRAQGIDPKQHWRAVPPRQIPTFERVSTELIECRESGWKNVKHRQQWRNTLLTYAKPIWGKAVDEVTVDDVLAILRPIWSKKPETAKRVRGRIEAVLDAAKVRGLRSGENPAAWKGNLALLLPKQRKGPKRHHPAMPYDEVPAFITRLKAAQGTAARALELLIHTATRTSEVLGARWDELDLETGVWTIPAERMKAGKLHRVPLTDEAKALLEALPRKSQYLFPASDPKKRLSNMAMTMVLARMTVRDQCTVHGFRSSFRDWCGDRTDFPRELAEQALAHQVGSEIERAYRRSDALDNRRTLMAEWSAHLVVPAQ